MIPVSAFFTSKSAAWMSLRRMFSTSSPTYPASVRAVASAMAKGTLRILASVWARRVLPEPVGPTSKILDFWSSVPSEGSVDLPRRRGVVGFEHLRPREFFVDDLVAQLDALVTDVDPRACDELPDLALALSAEGALQLIRRIPHPSTSSPTSLPNGPRNL